MVDFENGILAIRSFVAEVLRSRGYPVSHSFGLKDLGNNSSQTTTGRWIVYRGGKKTTGTKLNLKI